MSLLLLGGYLVARATLGALLNPPLNGPDEAGHVQYLRTLLETGGRHISGVEARQPPTYYLLAALPWLAVQGAGAVTQLFFVRLLGGLCGLATLVAAWTAATTLWPRRPSLALATAAVATLAPGYLFLLASANNDPLAVAFASLALVAAIHLWRSAAARCWLVVWLAASVAAVATKLTAAPLALALGGTLLVRRRRAVFRPRWTRVAAGAAALALLVGYGALLSRSPTSSLAAAAARFWLPALLRAPRAYVASGGLAESFRTFWYGYDYAVRWPRTLEVAVAGSAAVITLIALVGLALDQVHSARRTAPNGRECRSSCSSTSARPVTRLPWLLWATAGAQVALVVGRYGLGDFLNIEMGGAGQAKAFFPALVPLALLFVAGLAAAARRLRLRDERWLALGVFGWLVGLDAISLAVTTWQQYRWWPGGP